MTGHPHETGCRFAYRLDDMDALSAAITAAAAELTRQAVNSRQINTLGMTDHARRWHRDRAAELDGLAENLLRCARTAGANRVPIDEAGP